MKISICNALTGQQIIRDATPKEITTLEAEASKSLAEKAARELAASELRLIKISAYKKLGLTDAEIEALVPTPAEPKHNL
jgi:hypothetical protein